MNYQKVVTTLSNPDPLKSCSAGVLMQAPLNQHDEYVSRPEDWQLSNIEWKLDYTNGFFTNNNPKYIIDSTTGKRYLNEDRMLVRMKCIYPGLIFIALLSLFVGAVNIIYRSIKVLSGYHFWGDLEEEKIYEFTVEIQNGGSITHQVFQARFDDLSKMNQLVKTKNITHISIEKNDSKVCNLIVKTSQGEEVTIKAIENDQMQTTTDSSEVKYKLSNIKKTEETYDIETRFLKCIKDIARIIASFFIILPLSLAALYGLWKPYEARKLISSIALAVCGTDQVAACFAPSPSFHVCGGDINKQGAF